MPVLARAIEEAGFPTVIVTMMPEIAITLGAPRVVGVEFPFGHPFGKPNDTVMQRKILELSLQVLSGASAQVRIDVDVPWPVPFKEAYRAWQPSEPSPIVASILERIRQR